MQTPLTHCAYALGSVVLHEFPQLPQLLVSTVVSTQLLPHFSRLPEHTKSQMPFAQMGTCVDGSVTVQPLPHVWQFWVSVCRFLQAPAAPFAPGHNVSGVLQLWLHAPAEHKP